MNKGNNMTYYELFQVLRAMPPYRLRDTVTVYDGRKDEYIPVVSRFETTIDHNVLDVGHLVLVLSNLDNFEA
jgi:hypothetical protein